MTAAGVSPAQRALIVYRGVAGEREERLGRILSFFGVPWDAISITDGGAPQGRSPAEAPYAVLGAIDVVSAALDVPGWRSVLGKAGSLYGYASDDAQATARGLSTLTGVEWKWVSTSRKSVPIRIAREYSYLTGPMTGLEVTAAPAPADGVFVSSDATAAMAVISVDAGAAFLHTSVAGVPSFFCASTSMVDIDEPVGRNYFDIKTCLLSAVPLVMFVTGVFRDVMWRPPELGACLIIDDPLLKGRYGYCDFSHLRDLMRQHWFTTNIAFIPWNWRRTTRRASEFFRRESDLFSVSVHGCDHIAGEFGGTPEVIDSRARLALSRMLRHRARTRIKHDPIMVFPQGVFSSSCPGVLKRNGFVACVNTEISPVNTEGDGSGALIRDVWDAAILRYGSFPIYTRRYEHHGLENFAFDLLLGKPCFIVAHHEYFRDGGAALVRLVDKLHGLQCTLNWRSPREVVRRAFRSRVDNGQTNVRVYATEALLANPSDQPGEFSIEKPEIEPDAVARVAQDAHDLRWSHGAGALRFRCSLQARTQALVKVRYRATAAEQTGPVSVRYELAVAARRILSEFRDEYVLKLARPA